MCKRRHDVDFTHRFCVEIPKWIESHHCEIEWMRERERERNLDDGGILHRNRRSSTLKAENWYEYKRRNATTQHTPIHTQKHTAPTANVKSFVVLILFCIGWLLDLSSVVLLLLLLLLLAISTKHRAYSHAHAQTHAKQYLNKWIQWKSPLSQEAM